MPPMMRILLIGAGRAAYHLGHAWRKAGMELVGVVARDGERARQLAADLGTVWLPFGQEQPRADLRVLAVSDDAIAEVAASLPSTDAVTVHVSGARGLDVLAPHAHRGVLWPVQSLGGEFPLDLRTVPIVIEGSDARAEGLLRSAAQSLSDHVVELDHEQRRTAHLAAVLAGNFPVALLRAARRLLEQDRIDPSLLDALWRTVGDRAVHDADAALTGPARRGDRGTVDTHLARLAHDPDLRAAYAALSELVLHEFHPSTDPKDVR